MKTRMTGILLVVGILFWLALSLLVYRAVGWRHDYIQAEPLVQTIWPMADEMKRFSEQYGRSPESLEEIASYSPDQDFSVLRSYSHKFTATGAQRFFLRVNSRFAFAIDDQFRPRWAEFGSVLGQPKNPK